MNYWVKGGKGQNEGNYSFNSRRKEFGSVEAELGVGELLETKRNECRKSLVRQKIMIIYMQ